MYQHCKFTVSGSSEKTEDSYAIQQCSSDDTEFLKSLNLSPTVTVVPVITTGFDKKRKAVDMRRGSVSDGQDFRITTGDIEEGKFHAPVMGPSSFT